MTARRSRPAARILLLDPERRLLLFRFTAEDRPPFWCTPGGAVDPGESFAEAAARELREETGFLLDCGPEVARRVSDFVTLEGEPVTGDERFYLVDCAGGAIDDSAHTALERRVMREWRWFDAAALRAHDEPYYPADLIALLESLGRW